MIEKMSIDGFSFLLGGVAGWCLSVIAMLIDHKLKWGLFKEAKKHV